MVHFSHEGRVKNRELASSQRNTESVILYVFWSKFICDFVNTMTIDETIYYIIEIIILCHMYF